MSDFRTAKENSIEVYDKLERNVVLTRSARMRKFRFYQYKPVRNESLTTTTTTPETTPNTVLVPREDVVIGKTALKAEQSKELSDLDKQIAELEKRMADLDSNNLDEIFDLVNMKNDLIRRQMQLNILEKEKVLEKANEELTKELRSLLSIEDSRKTPAELERQQYLYDQSLALVNERNELVLHMDEQEKGIEDDNALKENLKTVISNPTTRNRLNGQDQNCIIQ